MEKKSKKLTISTILRVLQMSNSCLLFGLTKLVCEHKNDLPHKKGPTNKNTLEH